MSVFGVIVVCVFPHLAWIREIVAQNIRIQTFSRSDIEFDMYNLIKILLQLDLVQLARVWEILDALKGRLHETGLWRKSQSVEGPKYLLLKI